MRIKTIFLNKIFLRFWLNLEITYKFLKKEWKSPDRCLWAWERELSRYSPLCQFDTKFALRSPNEFFFENFLSFPLINHWQGFSKRKTLFAILITIGVLVCGYDHIFWVHLIQLRIHDHKSTHAWRMSLITFISYTTWKYLSNAIFGMKIDSIMSKLWTFKKYYFH